MGETVVTLRLQQLRVLPGQRVVLEQVSWEALADMLEELGEHRGTRLAYSQGTVEIVSPLPEYERAKVIISGLVKILLDELDMSWESLGSSTLRREDMAAGIEPDDCFYIQHHAQVIGRERLDLTVDPPPDLALEVDVTSQTQLQAYTALQIPERWRYTGRRLEIYVLQAGQYVAASRSPTFPQLPVLEGITQFVELSRTTGTAPALRAFRLWVREHRRR